MPCHLGSLDAQRKIKSDFLAAGACLVFCNKKSPRIVLLQVTLGISLGLHDTRGLNQTSAYASSEPQAFSIRG